MNPSLVICLDCQGVNLVAFTEVLDLLIDGCTVAITPRKCAYHERVWRMSETRRINRELAAEWRS